MRKFFEYEVAANDDATGWREGKGKKRWTEGGGGESR